MCRLPPSRCKRKIKIILLIGTVLLEIYDVIVDSMEAGDYLGGKALHLSKPQPAAVIAFIVIACLGALFSFVKIIFIVAYYWKITQRENAERNFEYYLDESQTNPEYKEEIERHFAVINLAIKSLTLILEDIAQAALPYWFVTRCSVDFDILKICFICVSPFLNFAYFTFIVVRFVWNYNGKHESKLRVFLVFLLIINIAPFAFGVLSSKVAFDRTHLIGDVPKIVLVQQKRVNQTKFGPESNVGILKEKSLYAVWRIIERADSHCANISLKCKNGSFFDNKIFDGCLQVRFILCYDSVLLNIVYRIQICKEYPPNCYNVPINKAGLSLRYTSDFCGENEANPEWRDVGSIYPFLNKNTDKGIVE